ncbi:hypothetical protein [Thiocapsa rosea]|uniref:hypothetical protein n=1 Tax=Thiocapsa rosea TaxID=69360 RepID=UPI0011C34442|nr:hypothetical protein [Thiocapsa rosea]
MSLLLVVAFLFLAIVLPTKHSYLLDVVTYGAEFLPDGSERSQWSLQPGVILCSRTSTPPKTQQFSTKVCDRRHFAVTKLTKKLTFVWDRETRVILRSTGDGDILVHLDAVPEGGMDLGNALLGEGFETLPVHSQMIIRRAVLAESGSQPMSGEIKVGTVVKGGATGLLDKGSFAIRQSLLWRQNPITVQEGTLAHGDRISFLASRTLGREKPPKEVTAYGYLSVHADAPGARGPKPFRMIVYTEPAKGTMRIERFGAKPSEVAPSWTDRALRDPWFLGLTAILSLGAIVTTLISSLKEIFARRRRDSARLLRTALGLLRTIKAGRTRR